MEKLILNIADLGALLGRTEDAIRLDLAKENWKRVPPPVRLGRQLTWTRDQILEWWRAQAQAQGIDLENPLTPPNKELEKRGPGRPKGSKNKPKPRRHGPIRKKGTWEETCIPTPGIITTWKK